MASIKESFQYGNHQVTIETGKIAKQATAATIIRMEDTVVMATVVASKKPNEGFDNLPLTVDYRERSYAAGKIPGGYFKREGRPAENEILISRLIDRPIRPLFADGFNHDVQIVVTVLSLNPEISADVPALIASSAALAFSGLPFNGPISAARVGYANGVYILNPSSKELENSELDLVVAGTEHGVLMVESEAKELSEEIMLGAVLFGHQQMQTAIQAIRRLATKVTVPACAWKPSAVADEVKHEVDRIANEELKQAYQITDKQERRTKIDEIYQKTADLFQERIEAKAVKVDWISSELDKLERNIVRNQILDTNRRIDGRDLVTVRPIDIEMSLLPRVHGSVLFTRGETQAIVVATLGSPRDAQIVDAVAGEFKDPFMLHYNFPPFSVGETGQVGSPKRREIGHGWLAKRGMKCVLPDQDTFPYVIRVVSEITESNGSSSMATVCGASLSLMDAGVPIKAPVAGIAMGLIKENERFAVLTDILGDEDHLGDMDFKVAGTLTGVTALQMDIKIDSITDEIMSKALAQAKMGRLHILSIMNAACNKPRDTLSIYAPRILTMNINPEKIRDVIGKGGVTIRGIIEETGASIDIDDSGLVKIASVSGESAQAAMKRINEITAEIEVGQVYQGKVVKLTEFGAFVSISPGKEGLLHISQISHEHVANVSDVLSDGQQVRVKVVAIDRQGRIRLSMREVEPA